MPMRDDVPDRDDPPVRGASARKPLTLAMGPAGMGSSSSVGAPGPALTGERPPDLETRIRDRIARRLGGRIHNLEVFARGKQIVLRGRCATYYSKQLAQHAALGAIEDESLENSIVVGPTA